jgi:hypothetical protein
MPSGEKLSEFTAWCRKNITGDEKGQAQIFLDRLFIAFGHPGSLDVGGEPEFRIRKATEDGGGTSFADYVWKPVVLIEMKKRGKGYLAITGKLLTTGCVSSRIDRATSFSATLMSSKSTTLRRVSLINRIKPNPTKSNQC